MKYTEHFKSNPQTEPAFGYDMIKNNAGGFGFQTSENQPLIRFLTLGTEGGTFYAGERKLTKDNAKTIVEMIKKNGLNVLAILDEYDTRVPKKDPSLFVLALCATYGNEDTKKQSYSMIIRLCHTATHLFTFVGMVNDLRGWSRGLRTGIANWYTYKSKQQIAYNIVKYRQRNGWSHRDVLRLCHAKNAHPDINKLFGYAVGKVPGSETNSVLVQNFEQLQAAKTATEAFKLISLSNNTLTWEMVPTQFLKDPGVQLALLQNMPMMATIRNLNRFAASGLTDTNLNEATKIIKERLRNEDQIQRSGIHPVFVLNALKTYGQGRGDKGSLTWTPNSDIVEALENLFEMSYGNVQSSTKDILLGVDISGSMNAPVGGMSLTAKEVAAAMMSVTLRNELNVETIFFHTQIVPVKGNRNTSYSDVLKAINSLPSGGTDLSLPMRYALDKKIKVDAIVTYTDNETWAGSQHPVQAFAEYQQRYNPNVKGIVVASTANDVDILPPGQTNVLGVSGFDSAVPNLVSAFIKGEI